MKLNMHNKVYSISSIAFRNIQNMLYSCSHSIAFSINKRVLRGNKIPVWAYFCLNHLLQIAPLGWCSWSLRQSSRNIQHWWDWMFTFNGYIPYWTEHNSCRTIHKLTGICFLASASGEMSPAGMRGLNVTNFLLKNHSIAHTWLQSYVQFQVKVAMQEMPGLDQLKVK